MNKITTQCKKIAELSATDCHEIVELHQSLMCLCAIEILTLLGKRDEVFLYRDSVSGKLVGTVGVEWIKYEKSVCLYIGNVIFSDNYAHKGLLTSCMNETVLTALKTYRGYEKYILFLSTSPEVYEICFKYKYSWPKPNMALPDNVRALMDKFSDNYSHHHYECHDDVFIVKSLHCANDKSALFKSHKYVSNKINTKEIFEKINPGASHGDQIVCCVKINFRNVCTNITRFLSKRCYSLLTKPSGKIRRHGTKKHSGWGWRPAFVGSASLISIAIAVITSLSQ
jgi:hypothetical protein